ncbi:sensor histidine kinase [Paenibacillus sp. TAB 01]|uniref:sensor histidine kinase n=1 Tax=Paenibacillus sp. TAB 01 TaxID=3368988 RepID=UPI003751E557
MTYSLYGKPAAGSAALFFVMNFNHLFQGPPLQAGLNLLLWVTFTVFLFLPRPRWTKVRIVLALCLLGIEIAAGVILYHEMKLLYFMAIFLFAAAIRMYVSKMQAPAMAVVLITAALYARFGRQDVFTLLSFVVFAAVLYFYIRSRIQRNEIYEQNKRHLAELQDAYDQLQQASATAMQYAVLEERTRIARDIHDAVGHSLTSLIVQMQALRFMVKKDPEPGRAIVKRNARRRPAGTAGYSDFCSCAGRSALRSGNDRLDIAAEPYEGCLRHRIYTECGHR